MSPEQYSPEQRKDIEERVEKARKLLEELQLRPACMPQMYNVGNDVFGIKLLPFLQDSKYTQTISPIQKDDLPPQVL